MSARWLRCRNPACSVPHGAVLGRLTREGDGLVLNRTVHQMSVYLDAGKVDINCPVCGTVRTFRGAAVFVDRGTM